MTETRPADPAPRWATPRNSDLPSFGPRVARLTAALGRPFMPWQQVAAGLIGEHDRGRRVHPLTVITIQRQAGKTTLLLAVAVDRCLFQPGARVWYTAQNGMYAREKWGELVTELTGPGSPFAGLLTVKLSAGSEKLIFPNGSQLRPFPPTKDALHSMQSDLVIVDEAWKFDELRGAELMQAIGPTQATRPGAQVVIVSTAGTMESTWLRAFVDRGRAADPAVSYLEWSITEDTDPLDLPAVAAAHPAVGHTIDVSFLEREAGILADLPAEFARAYGNAWTAATERVIPAGVWAAAATTAEPGPARVVIAADIAQDRTRSAIVVCANGVLEVVESQDGVDWVAPRILDLADRWKAAAVAVDDHGPSVTLHDDLVLAGLELEEIPPTAYLTACTAFVDRITDGTLTYRPHPNLDSACAAAVRRPVGDGWVWGRRRAAGPIPELVAATLAAYVDAHRPPPRRRPVARS